jgi:hypothetical protein
MCMQCLTTAAAAVGTASGLRAWLVERVSWMTPRRTRMVTIALLTLAVVVSGLGFSGSG